MPDEQNPNSNTGWQQPQSTTNVPVQNPASTTPSNGLLVGSDALSVSDQVPSPGGAPRFKKLIILLVTLLGIAGIGTGAYFVFFAGGSNGSGQQQGADASQAITLESVSGAYLVVPADMTTDYEDVTQDPEGGFFTYQSKTDPCSIIAGIVPQAGLAASLQNKTAEQVVETWMRSASFDGELAVQQSEETGTLVLKSADSTNATYSLPIVNYTATTGSDVEHYAQSVAITADGRLAMIVRWCGVLGSEADATLAKHDAKVREFTVRISEDL